MKADSGLSELHWPLECKEGIGHAAADASQGGSNRLFPRSITLLHWGSERLTPPESGDRARAFAQA